MVQWSAMVSSVARHCGMVGVDAVIDMNMFGLAPVVQVVNVLPGQVVGKANVMLCRLYLFATTL